MPETDFYVDVNMHFRQLKSLVLHKNFTGSAVGQIGYNTTTKRAAIHDGTTDKKVLQENDVLDEDDMSSDSDEHVPTQQSVKKYVDDLETDYASTDNGKGASKIGVEDTGGYYDDDTVEDILQDIGSQLSSLTGGINVQGDIDASTNPDYPAASEGDAYYITAAGKVGGASGKAVNIGDMVIAKNDNAGGNEATVGSDWFVLESNRDQATETVLGVAKIATNSLIDGNTDDTTIVTPLKLKYKLDSINVLTQEKHSLTGKNTASISAVVQGTKTFTVTGDITTHIQQGCVINITGSTGNDGLYSVVSATLNVGDTDIVVEETIPDSTADGSVEYGVKNTITLSNITATDQAQVEIFKSGKKVWTYIKVESATTITVWFLSPATGTFEALVQGEYDWS